MHGLCSIIICLIEKSEAYDEDNPTDALGYVFVDKDATCRNFVDEYLAKIPGYYQVLNNLKYMKALGGDIKKLADMFEQADYFLPFNYQLDQIDEMEISGEEKNNEYVVEQLDEIAIYGKKIINNDNERNKIEIIKNTEYQIIKDELNVGGANQIQPEKKDDKGNYEIEHQIEKTIIDKLEVQNESQQLQKENNDNIEINPAPPQSNNEQNKIKMIKNTEYQIIKAEFNIGAANQIQNDNIEINPVPPQSNEGNKQTSPRKVTGVEILAFVIAIACIVTGSIFSHYVYLGLIVSCILLFFASRFRKSKSQYENLKPGNTAVPRTDKLITNQRYDDQIQTNSNLNLINDKNNGINGIIEINKS